MHTWSLIVGFIVGGIVCCPIGMFLMAALQIGARSDAHHLAEAKPH